MFLCLVLWAVVYLVVTTVWVGCSIAGDLWVRRMDFGCWFTFVFAFDLFVGGLVGFSPKLVVGRWWFGVGLYLVVCLVVVSLL